MNEETKVELLKIAVTLSVNLKGKFKAGVIDLQDPFSEFKICLKEVVEQYQSLEQPQNEDKTVLQ